MQLVSLTQIPQTASTGQKSDGSDRITTTQQYWEAVVLDDLGRQQVIDFPLGGSQPTNQQIIDRITKLSVLVPSSKADLAVYARSLKTLWRDWKDIQDEMTARGFTSGTAAQQAALTAVTAQANAAWSDLLATLNSWRTAS